MIDARKDAERYFNDRPLGASAIDMIAYALERDREERPSLKEMADKFNEGTKALLDSGDYPKVALELQAMTEAFIAKCTPSDIEAGQCTLCEKNISTACDDCFNRAVQLAHRNDIEAGLVKLADPEEGWGRVCLEKDNQGWRCAENTAKIILVGQHHDTPGEAVRKAVEELEK